MSWLTDQNFSFFKWLVFFILAILFGFTIALIVSSIILLISFIRNKNKDEKKDMGNHFINIFFYVLSPSLVTGAVIVILWTAGIRYPGFPLELLIGSAILITGLFLSISDKNAISFFVCLAIIITILVLRATILAIKKLICKYKQSQ